MFRKHRLVNCVVAIAAIFMDAGCARKTVAGRSVDSPGNDEQGPREFARLSKALADPFLSDLASGNSRASMDEVYAAANAKGMVCKDRTRPTRHISNLQGTTLQRSKEIAELSSPWPHWLLNSPVLLPSQAQW